MLLLVAGAGLVVTVTVLLPEIPTALPSDADVTSPLKVIVIVPSPVAVHVALNDLLVSIASAVASAWLIEHPLTGPLAVTWTFHAAEELILAVTVKESPT